MTLPPSYGWYTRGGRLRVPYEAPRGRRVNAVGAYFTHGPLAGRLLHQSWASLPRRRPLSRAPGRPQGRRKTPQEVAAAHGLTEHGLTEGQVGPIDGARLVAFVWRAAGRPADAPRGWKRERPLVIVLDNYSVHRGQVVREALPALAAADVFVLYLPPYCPELSGIEPVWRDVKGHQMPTRSFDQVAPLKRAADEALTRKAAQLWEVRGKPTNLDHKAT